MVYINMFHLINPSYCPNVNEKFDEQGNLTDEHTKEKIKELLEALVDGQKN